MEPTRNRLPACLTSKWPARLMGSSTAYTLEPNDMLLLPAGVPYEYRNSGLEQASFASIAGRVDEWPAKAHYAGIEGEVVVHGSTAKETAE